MVAKKLQQIVTYESSYFDDEGWGDSPDMALCALAPKIGGLDLDSGVASEGLWWVEISSLKQLDEGFWV